VFKQVFSPQHIALVDCNNFYVSCERLFRPDLADKPIAVLSNNDGCIVSRSQEVKDLGIKMAVPVHQVRDLIEQHQVHLFSSNYALYADLSARVMHSLKVFSPNVEVYSIDEAFMDLDRWHLEPEKMGHEIRKSIGRWIGLPVSVGIAPTKTLAKLASHAAKKWPKTGGVVDISSEKRRRKLMQLLNVREVWGVGRQLAEKMNQHGIYTAWDLQSKRVEWIRKQFNITVARTVQELQGTPAIAFVNKQTEKKQLICSRSFKNRISEKPELQQVLSVFCLRTAEKLRAQKGLARQVTVSICTSPLEKKPYSNSATYRLKSASQDSRVLLKITKALLEGIFKVGCLYQKAGVTLGDIQNVQTSDTLQGDLFSSTVAEPASSALMGMIDEINKRFSDGVKFGAVGNKKLCQTTPINHSSHYTTDWKELARVRI